jgi:thiol-disulfide isomerase/thioredoxin
MVPQLGPKTWALTLAVVAVLLVLSGCTGNASVGAAENGDTTALANGDRADMAAPDFTLPSLDGEPFRLSETQGKIRLIDFWATWCAPCREEVPMLNELQAEYRDQGLLILAITDEEAGVVRDFVQEHGVEYLNLIGTGEIAEAYGVLGLPAAYLVDAEGQLVKTFLGPKPRRVLVEQIEALLDDPPSS